MEIKRDNKEIIYTSPNELRSLADKMEQIWSKSDPGDFLGVTTIDDESTKLVFVIDQSQMAAADSRQSDQGAQRDTVPSTVVTAREFADLMEKRNYTIREVGIILELIRARITDSKFLISKKGD